MILSTNERKGKIILTCKTNIFSGKKCCSCFCACFCQDETLASFAQMEELPFQKEAVLPELWCCVCAAAQQALRGCAIPVPAVGSELAGAVPGARLSSFPCKELLDPAAGSLPPHVWFSWLSATIESCSFSACSRLTQFNAAVPAGA